MTPAQKARQDSVAWGYNSVINLLAGKAAEKRLRQGSGIGWVRMVTALEVTAHHEAAHGVASHLLLGEIVHRLSVDPIHVPDTRGRDQYLTGHCIHSTNPDPGPIGTPVEMESDRRKALKLCLLLCPAPMSWGNAKRYYRVLEIHAAGFVDRHWALIRALADELLKYRTLDREHIDKILRAPGLDATEWTPPKRCAESRAIQ
jgi:hypothetical protein